MPKLCQGDKVRAHLDMDRGELRFSLCKADEGWKEIPHVITGIQCPVVAACCIQVPPLSPVPRPAPPRPAPRAADAWRLRDGFVTTASGAAATGAEGRAGGPQRRLGGPPALRGAPGGDAWAILTRGRCCLLAILTRVRSWRLQGSEPDEDEEGDLSNMVLDKVRPAGRRRAGGRCGVQRPRCRYSSIPRRRLACSLRRGAARRCCSGCSSMGDGERAGARWRCEDGVS